MKPTKHTIIQQKKTKTKTKKKHQKNKLATQQ